MSHWLQVDYIPSQLQVFFFNLIRIKISNKFYVTVGLEKKLEVSVVPTANKDVFTQ